MTDQVSAGTGVVSYPRLRSSGDIRAVFAARQMAHGASMVVHGRRRGDEEPGRAAVIAGRRIGSAVARNRVKRRLRAVLADRALPVGYDLVVVARSPAGTADFRRLGDEFERLLGRVATRGEEPAA